VSTATGSGPLGRSKDWAVTGSLRCRGTASRPSSALCSDLLANFRMRLGLCEDDERKKLIDCGSKKPKVQKVMSKELWQVTGSRQGKLLTVKIRAASWREAVRIGSTTYTLAVHECALLDDTPPELLQAKCIAAAPSITPPLSPPPSAETPPPPPVPPTAAAAPITRESKTKQRRNRQTKIYTDEKLATIPALLEQGLTREQIAETFGGKVNSLQVVCSKKGISLWRRDRTRKPVELPDVELTIWLKDQTLERLRQRAEVNGLTKSELASRLLNLIASENLFDAVLDEARI
jgi:hypothetical protein